MYADHAATSRTRPNASRAALTRLSPATARRRWPAPPPPFDAAVRGRRGSRVVMDDQGSSPAALPIAGSPFVRVRADS